MSEAGPQERRTPRRRSSRRRSGRPSYADRRPAGSARPRSSAARRWCRRSATPTSCRSAQRRDDIAAAIRDHQVVIVAGETGSGKTTQLPKICLELGRGVARHDRPHPAAPDRRPQRRRADRRGARHRRWARRSATRSGSPTRSATRHAGQGDDRRHPARRDPARPDAAALRHADHRRGARAQPQHRLHPRLPQAAAAAAARPQGRSSPRRRSTRSGSPRTSRRRRRADHRGVRAHLPGRGALPAAGRGAVRRRGGRAGRPRPDRGDRRRGRGAARPRGPATSWCSCPASGRSATPPTCSTQARRGRRRLRRACRCTPGCPSAEQHRVFERHSRPPGRAGHQRRRDLADRARASGTSSTPALARISRYSAAHQGAAAADRADQPGLGQPALRAAAAASRPASASGSTARRTSSPGRSSPSRRSCAPTWPR